ncbi:MAG: asparaginase [Vampirovibrio sp.]|nr:asparaginase [Vampirovibrio sp.]
MEAQSPIEVCLLAVENQALRWATPNALTLETLARSCLKPFQAVVLVEALQNAGIALETIPTQEIAIACSSHSGQVEQVKWVQWLLAQANQSASELACGSHLPIDATTAHQLIKAESSPCTLHHNCSGNHAGLLWACQLQGLPSAGYQNPSHPIQQQIFAQLQALLPQKTNWTMALDGCTLPTYAFTLVELAQLASAFTTTPSGTFLLHAMTKNPQLVAGTGRFDTVLMQACQQAGVEIVSKGGAEGLVLLWHLQRKEVAVLKTISGDGVLRDFAIVRLLRLWGWLDGLDLIEPFELETLPTPYATIPNTFELVINA